MTGPAVRVKIRNQQAESRLEEIEGIKIIRVKLDTVMKIIII